MIVRDYIVGDIADIKFQKQQEHEIPYINIIRDNAKTLICDGEIMAIIWFERVSEGRFFLYSVISANAGKHMVSLVKTLKRIIDEESEKQNATRLEFTVDEGFEQGVRLAKMLGFVYEGTLHKLFNGLNFYLFARF